MAYEWLQNRYLRSVDQLRLWRENPRLDPEETHLTNTDYAADLLNHSGERQSFIELIKSIAKNGFIPADPIVVWKNDNNERFYVAEGNRRVLALKLLRHPSKAPKSIRSIVTKQARFINRDNIAKIEVSIAPSFESAEWYINQRHATSGLQRGWSRHQQQRWIAKLYDKYEGDVSIITEITGFTKPELESTLRILYLRDIALKREVLELLEPEEREAVRSHRLPMTILERWFDNTVVRETWGLEANGSKASITSDESSFYRAYALWISLVLRRNEPDVPIQINTRTITTNLDQILAYLPAVKSSISNRNDEEGEDSTSEEAADDASKNDAESDDEVNSPKKTRTNVKNPNRPRLVPEECDLDTGNHKLESLFEEFKIIPYRYKNCVAASLRVFVDLSVLEHINSQNLVGAIEARYHCALKDVPLKKRLEYLKSNTELNKDAVKVISKLVNSDNEYSLDTLNNYIHGTNNHHTNKAFLNGFWDFLFPLLEVLLDIEYR